MSVHIFGIRHHGPGCARALRQALEELRPDVLLVEGPPDAEAALPLLAHDEMRPPVALLLYVPDQPSRAVFYPFTDFSPEWQALRHALERGISARFMDLPQAVHLAREPEPPEGHASAKPESPADLPAAADGSRPHGAAQSRDTAPGHIGVHGRAPTTHASAAVVPSPTRLREDPLALLAEAAGYSDHELWWERQIEQRRDATGLFEGILEAMTALRDDLTPRDDEEAQREAHMRQTIRAAEREGFQRIAVVCGAWHAPVLAAGNGSPSPVSAPGRAPSPHDARSDAALLKGLKGLKRVKVEATWIPWTNSRLAYRSGYGAGVASPGWYTHLWNADDRGTVRWVTRAAHLLREEGLDASSASVIEAVRLAEALAAMRSLPMPGMAELHEAIQTVLCNGDEAPMRLIRDKLEIGETMGAVPSETPAVPLQRDLEMKQRRLKMPATTEEKLYELDLRNVKNALDQERSRLLHQMGLLGVEWGKTQRVYGNKQGDFHEWWKVKWEPEFAVKLIEANVWGNSVESAATNRVAEAADEARDLPIVTNLLERVVPAGLSDAVERVLMRVQVLAAVAADVGSMMNALPALASTIRYGSARYGLASRTSADRVLPVYDGLFARALVGLPGACASLDDDAAANMVASIDRAQDSVALLNRDDQRDAWLAILRALTGREAIHGLVRGRCCRLLLEAHAMDDAELQRLAGLALSPVVPAGQSAAWIEGVLRGPGLLLLHQDGLWRALDGWLADLAPDTFTALLPLLRRAFSGFHGPERRAMGERVAHLRTIRPGAAATSTEGPDLSAINQERARLVLPILSHVLRGTPIPSLVPQTSSPGAPASPPASPSGDHSDETASDAQHFP